MKYAQFHGRARRREFWLFVLFVFIVVSIAASVDFTLGLAPPWAYLGRPWSFGQILPVHVLYGGPFTLLTSLLLVIPSLAVTVRRLHDSDRSGAWVFINLIPFIGGIVILLFMILDGTPGPNAYGPDPQRRRLERY